MLTQQQKEHLKARTAALAAELADLCESLKPKGIRKSFSPADGAGYILQRELGSISKSLKAGEAPDTTAVRDALVACARLTSSPLPGRVELKPARWQESGLMHAATLEKLYENFDKLSRPAKAAQASRIGGYLAALTTSTGGEPDPDYSGTVISKSASVSSKSPLAVLESAYASAEARVQRAVAAGFFSTDRERYESEVDLMRVGALLKRARRTAGLKA